MKKLTFEEFLKKAQEKHGEDFLYEKDSYVNTKEKMWITHKKCGFKFQQTPHKHLSGQGCPKCCYSNRKTDYSFTEKAEKRFGKRYSFPFLEKEYQNSHSRITIKCNFCGKTFFKLACDFITSQYGGCQCQKESEDYITYEQISQNKHVIPFEGRKHKTKDTVQIECPTHGIYKKIINNVLKGNYKCPKCSLRNNGAYCKLHFKEIEKEIKEKYPNISIVDKEGYQNTSSKIKFKCNTCGNVFERVVGEFLYRKITNPCPHCSKIVQISKRTKTQEKFEKEVREKYGERYEVISEYITSDKKIQIKCNECGRIFEIEANSFLQGHECPYHNLNFSNKENEIMEFIKTAFPNAISHDREVLNGYEIDIYVTEKQFAIEYDGLYWHSDAKKDRNYHLNKTNKCEKNGIELIHIFEDEWLYKSEIWKSMLNKYFGITKNIIKAKECTIKNVSTKETKTFLETNHIQGYCPSTIKIGLYYKGELSSIMTFRKLNENDFELLRLCTLLNTNIENGYIKIFSSFIKLYNPKTIIAHVDRRFPKENFYRLNGFKEENVLKPNFWYVYGTKRTKNKIVTKKANKIYDCGAKIYKWYSNKV